MNVNYFFNLYGRNLKGAFLGLWEHGLTGEVNLRPAARSYPVPAPWLPAPWLPAAWLWTIIPVLPLAMIIGATIKTIFDCCTRKYTPQDQVDSVVSSIEKMNPDMGEFVEQLNKAEYSPKSNSSSALFLRELSTSELGAANRKIGYQNFNEAEQELFSKDHKRPLSRDKLVGYMRDEKNNGKKLFQMAVAFFTGASPDTAGTTAETPSLVVNNQMGS